MGSENKDFYESDDDLFLLNGSALTIRRIDALLRDISFYSVSESARGFRNNLRELWKETQGYLPKNSYSKAVKDWASIESYDITVNSNNYTVSYDKKLLLELQSFHTWLLLRLHRAGVTMGKKPDPLGGFGKMVRTYGVKG